ncbi:hypothetical protein MC7420_7300 [Coleofasciculus chthonoplastes PCC 7420]|uniref:Uncharacterized protein n=1 Tax=Coleofasciculus chthonoplastes PCC 7420 TaxID=118168 RepID=B4VI85_9CYAN|nr:hypothetical protein [Coleofasciculus chthonoplastes]EDX78647.1 hypothetical protein MC7420_7300 [Coleofasciculus chthonoplastes PCC 7420]
MTPSTIERGIKLCNMRRFFTRVPTSHIPEEKLKRFQPILEMRLNYSSTYILC